MKNYKEYFTGFYEKVLYRISMFGANLANKSLLTLIEFKGLDPNVDLEKLKANRFQNELTEAFDLKHIGRAASKIPVAIPWCKKEPREGYVIRSKYSGSSIAMPDYSNSNDNSTNLSLKSALNSLFQLAEKIEAKYKVTPATIVPPEVEHIAYVTESKDWHKNAVNSLVESIRKSEDERILEILDSADQSSDHTIEKESTETVKKKRSSSKNSVKNSKKSTKKPAKKSRKR